MAKLYIIPQDGLILGYFLFYNHCFKNNKTQGGVPWVLYYLSSRAKRILYTCYFA